MKLYTPYGSTGSGVSTRKTLQDEFNDLEFKSFQGDINSRINNKFITTIREVALQNGIDSFRRSKKSTPLKLKISTEEVDLTKIQYFVELKATIEAGISKLKSQGSLTDGKKEKIGLLEDWLSNFGRVKILKIEDNGNGLSGSGRRGDFDTCGTRAILGDGESDKGDGAGGSFGKGAKTAFYLSKLNTVFYESAYKNQNQVEFNRLSLGHSYFPTFDNQEGQIIGDPVFAVSLEQDQNHSGIPTWHKGSLPVPFNRTLNDESGLTISSVGVDIPDNWIDQTCFAIVTSHLGILLDEEFNWEIQIGPNFKLKRENLLEIIKDIGEKDFIKKGDFNVKIQYEMCLSWIQKKLKKIDFEPFKMKAGRNSININGYFLLGESPKIQAFCIDEELEGNKNPYLNHFLFVREGMTIRTAEVQYKKGEMFKLNPNEGKYFGYVFMNADFSAVIRQAENPSHDKLNSQRLISKKGDNIPKPIDFNKALLKISNQLLKYIEGLEGERGERAKLDLFNTPGENDDSLYDSPLVDLNIEFVPTSKTSPKTQPVITNDDDFGPTEDGDEENNSAGVVGGEGQASSSPGPNQGDEAGSASPDDGLTNRIMAYESYIILEEFVGFKLTASIICHSSSNFQPNKFFICESIDRDGNDLTDILFTPHVIKVDNEKVEYELENLKVRGKTIKCIAITCYPSNGNKIDFKIECTSKLKSVPNFLILASNE